MAVKSLLQTLAQRFRHKTVTAEPLITSIPMRPQITSRQFDNYDNPSKDSSPLPLPTTVVTEIAMESDQKHSYEALEDFYDDNHSAYDAQSLELKEISTSGGSTPTSASVLVPVRHPTFYADRPSKPVDSPLPYSPRRRTLSEFSKKHPFASGFQVPHWKRILLHTALCIVSYPIILTVMLIARNKSIFWTRFIVGVGCGFVGLYLGYSLLQLGRRHIEAAAWATIIHQSRFDDSSGVRLRDLASTTEDSTSPWSALLLLWNRAISPATARRVRQDYDHRRWSLVIIFFLIVVLAAGSLPFVLGRLIYIDSSLMHQLERYEEITVKGGSSDADIARAAALVPTFENYALTWTMASFSSHGGLPPVASFAWNNSAVFFSETTMSQLLPNGSGFGTFDSETMAPSLQTSSMVGYGSVSEQVYPGSVIRYPKWGLRIQCTKLPDANVNLVPFSQNNMTYIFTPREVLVSLFSSLGMDYPESSMAPFNITQTLIPGDLAPSGLNTSDIALGAAFYDTGACHSLFSRPVSMGTDGKGFISIEEVLVRLNTTYAPNATFAAESSQSITDAQGNPTQIGYDVAVCVEVLEPWIVEVYNSTVGQPNSIRIVGPGNQVESLDADDLQEKLVGLPLSATGSDGARQLNSNEMADVYEIAHDNGVNQLLKNNGVDTFYVPSPTVVSFSGGDGPYGYTGLSAAYFAQARALSDATNLLPYLTGSGDLLARSYTDLVLSSTSINPFFLAIYLIIVFLLGLLAGFFVPKLPLNVPHRGFEVYSWIAAFHADELMEVGRTANFERNMELHEIAQQLGDLKFRYMDPHMGSLSKV